MTRVVEGSTTSTVHPSRRQVLAAYFVLAVLVYTAEIGIGHLTASSSPNQSQGSHVTRLPASYVSNFTVHSRKTTKEYQ